MKKIVIVAVMMGLLSGVAEAKQRHHSRVVYRDPPRLVMVVSGMYQGYGGIVAEFITGREALVRMVGN